MALHRLRTRPADWPDWFERKGYLHFDQPIRNPNQIRDLVESPERIARHGFLPFMRFTKVTRKFKAEPGHFVAKPRPLSYASHLDAQIYRRYSLVLSPHYEASIAGEGIADSVLAYRRFEPPKCNIHFANDAFHFIETNAPCVAMACDIKDFFESLNHKLLKEQWKRLTNQKELARDHYAVYKSITRYSWVERDVEFDLFGITKKIQSKLRGPICTPEQFRTMVRTSVQREGLIQVKMDGKGVPQGSPISALLSNIYMLPVDIRLAKLAKTLGGLYFRYSDDILIVCRFDMFSKFRAALEEAISSLQLQLHDGPGKVAVARFNRGKTNKLTCDRPLQYLGFTFDGESARIRSHTVARFFRRMRKAIRHEKYLAERSADIGGDPRVRKRFLYDRFSHLGKNNFISYANKARAVFDKNAIRQQIKHHWRDLNAMLVIE